MTLASLAAFAGAIFVLFFTPGPGNVAMVARTLDAGPVHGFVYGGGIITGDIFWLTVAVTGLSAASAAPPGLQLAAKLVGAGFLVWLGWRALRGVFRPAEAGAAERPAPTRLGLLSTYAAGVAMPLSNPKPIVFYLSFLPAFFDLSAVGPGSYAAMVAIMLAMYGLTAAAHVGGAHAARDWLASRRVRRVADAVAAVVMFAVAGLLLAR